MGNGSMIIYGNGYNPWSPSLIKKGNTAQKENVRRYLKKNWIKNHGDEVIVKIDTKTMKAVIWNETELKVGDVKMDKIANQHSEFAFLFEFPMDIEMAILIEMGNTSQTVSIL